MSQIQFYSRKSTDPEGKCLNYDMNRQKLWIKMLHYLMTHTLMFWKDKVRKDWDNGNSSGYNLEGDGFKSPLQIRTPT